MVLDSLKNSGKYFSLNPYFKQAFDYLAVNDLSKSEPGKIILDGDNLYISVMEIEGKKPENAKMEAHKKYIDIQIVLEGVETMGWLPLDNCQEELEPYNEQKDIIFYKDKPTAYVVVNPGEFTIFFPEDGHAPAIGNGPIKKAVIKIQI